jgi:hypothetical protein
MLRSAQDKDWNVRGGEKELVEGDDALAVRQEEVDQNRGDSGGAGWIDAAVQGQPLKPFGAVAYPFDLKRFAIGRTQKVSNLRGTGSAIADQKYSARGVGASTHATSR